MEQENTEKAYRQRNQMPNKKRFLQLIRKQNNNKKQSNRVKKKKKNVGYSSGQWNLRQTKLYVRYLSTHKNEFTDSHLRKKNKVFIKLADFIGSRTPDQCRSHHQKATRKFSQFDDLLGYYQQRINEQTKLLNKNQMEKQKPVQIKQGGGNEDERWIAKKNQMFSQNCQKDQEELAIKIEDKIMVQNQNAMNQNRKIQQVFKRVEGPQKLEKATGFANQKNFFSLNYSSDTNIVSISIDSHKIGEYCEH